MKTRDVPTSGKGGMVLMGGLRALFICIVLMFLSGAAIADTTPTLLQSFAGYVNFIGTQKTLRTGSNSSNTSAASLVTGTTTASGSEATSATLPTLPSGTNTIRAAYLYWAGSGSTPDYDVVFENESMTADHQYTITNAANDFGLNYFSGVKDVTSIVKDKLADNQYTFKFAGLTVNNGSPWLTTQAVLAGWALFVVYENTTAERLRVLNVYEGFQPFYGSSIPLTISNFLTPTSNRDGRMAHLTWEGDVTNSTSLDGFSEQLTFNSNVLTDSTNPSSNQYNSASTIRSDAIDTASYGIDFDVYDIGNYLSAGQTAASSVYSSGADLVLLSMEVISVANTPVSDLAITMTRNTALAQGQSATYTFNVSNNGPSSEDGPVTVTQTLPTGLSYSSFSGSGWSCGVSGQIVTCTRSGSLASGASASPLTLTVSVGTCTSDLKVSTVQVTGIGFDNVSSNDTATDSYDMGLLPCVYYAMDETSWGTVSDSSGHNFHGASLGSAMPTGYPVSTPGGAISGNPGTCGAGSIPSSTGSGVDSNFDINTLGNAGTIMFWYRGNSAWGDGVDRMLFDASNELGNGGADKHFYLVKGNSGRLRFALENSSDDNTDVRVASGAYTNPGANTWQHVAVTWDLDAGTARIYLNGTQVASDSASGTLGNMNTLYLGARRFSTVQGTEGDYTSNTANGLIDEVRMYGKALTASQITQAMALTHNCLPPDHIRIEHDGAGMTCMPETVTVKACVDASCSTLYTDSVTTTLSPSGWTTNPITFTGGSTTASQSVTSAQTVTLGASSTSPVPTNAARCFNGTTETCSLTFSNCTVAACGSGSVSGVINTYYPVTQSLASGTTAITVGSSTGNSTQLASGDLVLIMQMQDATISTTNTSLYGSTSAVNAGKYEYAKVAWVLGNSVNLTSGLVNSYTYQGGSDTAVQKTIQLIRVPMYSSATLGSNVTASAWNGSTGGVLAFDVSGTLSLNNATIDVSGKGFRGGGGRRFTGGTGDSTDYRTLATNNANGSKGEGIAGTPRYVNNGGSVPDNGVEGYPVGSFGRGAPANAGGGGTDDDPAANDENTGGGGGANAGGGGMGGYAWSNSTSPGRGIGGAAVSGLGASQLVMGGGGGAGTTNNGTGTPGSGFASSGAAGGGIVMIRAGSMNGTGTLNVSGASANNTVANDGSGGGGAAGSAMVYASSGLDGLTIIANGGNGGTNTGNGSPHGPGGGGGGGLVLASGALASCSVLGGANGTTSSSNAYGATSGSAGSCSTALTSGAIAGTAFSTSACPAALDHYELSLPTSSITCLPTTATVTACADSSSPCTNKYTGANGTTATLGASAGTLAATTVTFDVTGVATTTLSYPGAANGTPVTVTLSGEQIAAANPRKCCPDGVNCVEADSCSSTFKTAGFIFSSAAGGAVATISSQVAGTTSGTYYLRAVKTDDVTKACEGALSGSQSVGFGYECNDPSTCYASNLMSVSGGTSTTINGYNSGSAASNVAGFTSVNMTFDGDGNAPFTFNYGDVGFVKLWAGKTVNGTVLTGSSNSFIVKPYDFLVEPCAGTPCTAPSSDSVILTGGGSVFAKAGNPFTATITARTSGGAATPSFGQGTKNGVETVGLSHARLAPTAAGSEDGALGGTTSILRSSFSNGIASVTDLTWNEVGVISLKATNSTFIDQALLTEGTSGQIGRFVPDHFDTVVSGGLQPCPTALVAAGLPCPTLYDGFIYSAQPFSTEVTARNAAAAVTKNYAGTFAKDVTLSAWDASGSTVTQNPPGTAPGTLTNGLVAAGLFSSGIATVNTTYTLPNAYPSATAPPAPTNIYLRAADTDSVTSLRGASTVEGGIKVVSGRLLVHNAYGSELLKLPIGGTIQYYDGSRWTISDTDNASQLVAPANVLFANPKKNLDLAEVSVLNAPVTTTIAGGLCPQGRCFILAAPGAGNNGSVDIKFASPAWLPSTTGRATFGLYKAGPVIYLREVFR